MCVRGLRELGQIKEKDMTVRGSDAQPTSLRGAWAGLRERALAAGVCPEALSGCYSEGEEGKKEEDQRTGFHVHQSGSQFPITDLLGGQSSPGAYHPRL